MPHIHDKVDFTVEVFIVCKDRVLLRKHDKYGIWLSVGGHIELDEDPVESALREVKEEVGLDVELIGTVQQSDEKNYKELLPPRFVNRHRISDTHEHIAFTYFAASASDNVVQGDTEQTEEWKWLSKKELKNLPFEISEHVQRYALAALDAAASTSL